MVAGAQLRVVLRRRDVDGGLPGGHFTGSLSGHMTQRLLRGGPSPLVEEMASVLPLECSLLSHRGWGDLRRPAAGPASG